MLDALISIAKRASCVANANIQRLICRLISGALAQEPARLAQMMPLLKELLKMHCGEGLALPVLSALAQSYRQQSKPDKMIWADLPIIPQDMIELSGLLCGLPSVRRNQPYLSTTEYFDTYFRLFRADAFAALAKGLDAYLQHNDASSCGLSSFKVQLHALYFGRARPSHSGTQAALAIKACCNLAGRQHTKWIDTKALMDGNLVYLVVDGDADHALWATISDAQSIRSDKFGGPSRNFSRSKKNLSAGLVRHIKSGQAHPQNDGNRCGCDFL